MASSPDQGAAVEAWLRRKFPDARVESGHTFDREVELLRARDQKAPTSAKEIEISDAAFQDHRIEETLEALQLQKAATLLAQRPERRPFLTRMPRLPPRSILTNRPFACIVCRRDATAVVGRL